MPPGISRPLQVIALVEVVAEVAVAEAEVAAEAVEAVEAAVPVATGGVWRSVAIDPHELSS